MKILDELKACGAIIDGHFVLSSGAHSDTFINVPAITRRIVQTRHICEALGAKFVDDNPDAVVGVASGGSLFAALIAQCLEAHYATIDPKRRVTFVDTRKRPDGSLFIQPHDIEVISGNQCLIVDDLITTGGTAHQVVEEIRGHGGNAIGVGAIVRRGEHNLSRLGRVEALCSITPVEYEPGSCPLCEKNVPISAMYGQGQ